MKRVPHPFKAEADLCAAFIAWVQPQGWTAFAETASWDILLVHGDGTQIGVHAKLRLNLDVIGQAIGNRWNAWDETGPDFRAVLVPWDDGRGIAQALGLEVLYYRGARLCDTCRLQAARHRSSALGPPVDVPHQRRARPLARRCSLRGTASDGLPAGPRRYREAARDRGRDRSHRIRGLGMTVTPQLPDPLVPAFGGDRHMIVAHGARGIFRNARARLAPEEAAFRPALSSRPYAGALPESEMPTYNEKLRDPRWQRMRLEIMSRDSFACRKCGSGDKTLNVHHLFYDKGFDPWDYPATSLVTLCEQCHKDEHANKWPFEGSLIWTLRSLGALNKQIIGLAVGINRGADAYEMTRRLSDEEWDDISRAICSVFTCARGGGDDLRALVAQLQAQFPIPDPA